ncbi:MAG: histidine phosphatase family protein [bacterium]|nr:histidine phosphatase family protein [bacterium]
MKEQGVLILARHHESEWNKLGLWTGKRDRHLTEYGFEKSNEMGQMLKDAPDSWNNRVDRAFASMQVRSIETLSCMLNTLGFYDVPTEHASTLNERDYGDYTGKDKWEMQKLLGTENWERLRREWDYPVPNGETLKDVSARSLPYFLEHVLPALQKGESVLVVAHGNSCRALIKHIESISDEGIKDVEMPFGEMRIYRLDNSGLMLDKKTVSVKSKVNA